MSVLDDRLMSRERLGRDGSSSEKAVWVPAARRTYLMQGLTAGSTEIPRVLPHEQ